MNLLLSRRAFGCALAATLIERAFAVPAGVGELPAKRMSPGQLLPLPWGSPESALNSGVIGALGKELAIAQRVLEKAPSTVNPYEVAQYFDRVGRGLENPPGEDWKPYVQEWPERYNPIILNFFDATTIRKPEGDCTAWCSAFVNWCIERGRTGRSDTKKLIPITRSASAMSFQNWGRSTSNPKPGDIVLFRNVNSPGHGHVGFYSGQTDDFVIVLGGNQGGLGGLDPNDSTCSDPRSVGGRVVEQRLRKRGSSLVLHSFRTDPSLHDLSDVASESPRTSESKPSQTEESKKSTQGTGKGETPDTSNKQANNTNTAQTPDKPTQQTPSTNPAQTPDKPAQQTPNPNQAQTPDKPIQQTPNTNQAQTPDKSIQQTSPAQDTIKPTQQAPNTNSVQIPDKPIQQTPNNNLAKNTIKPTQQTTSVNPTLTKIKPNQPTTPPTSVTTKETIVEVELPNRRVLRVSANIDPDVLARLVDAIGK